MAAKQHVRLSVADPVSKHLEVEHTVEGVGTDSLRVRMPVWCPGSYLVREYAQHVSRFAARAGANPLTVHRVDKNTWEIDTAGSDTVTFAYRVYAPELTVRTNDVTPEHAFVHPPATFMVVDGRADEAVDLEVDAPAGWAVSTALDHEDGRYLADDFERLADCPLEIGPHEVHRFEAGGRPHEFVVHGSNNLDVERALVDTKKIVETELAMFGGEAPYDRYLFVLHCTHDKGGGLEHTDSTALAWPKLAFRPDEKYRKFLTLIAHEFFHVWNVKRIRPSALTTIDWFEENYTRLLWVFEGFTNYYDEMIPVRAGCTDAKTLLKHLGEHVTREASRPGGTRQSLEDSSLTTWVGLYRATADTLNEQTNYYLKGLLVAWKLDLTIRAATGDARSLDDVMRHLWAEYGRTGRGVDDDAMAAIVQAATGVDVADFLHTHVSTPGRLVYDDVLAHVGLRVRRRPDPEDEPRLAWLGFDAEDTPAGVRVRSIVPDGPAHRGGLGPGDEIVAFDGHRIAGSLDDRRRVLPVGTPVAWSAFRRDRLVHGTLVPGEDPVGTQEVIALDDVADTHRQSFEAWTGRPFGEIVDD